MIVNSLLFACYAILLFISLIGYGLVFNKFYKLSLVNNHNNQFFGEICFFSLIILIPFSILINFFSPVSYLVSSIIFTIGILLFFFYINIKKYYSKIIILLLILFLFSPFFVLIIHHDDFYYYHLPYLNVLQFSKIIFGLVNLNTVLVYPQNIWFNVFSLFRIPIIDYNGLQVLNGIFTIAFILFCYEVFLKTESKKIKIISLTKIVFVLSLFSRLKDHGAEIVPQILMLIVFLYSFILIFDNKIDRKNTLIKIGILLTISILLRLSSIVILPFLGLIIFLNFYLILQQIKKIKFLSIIMILISLVLTKNLINSGCLVYPLSISCFKQTQVSWSIDKEIPKINENVILSYTRGWMIYAKENINNSSKFIFNPDDSLLSHKEYLSKGINFWIKYWLKDPDITRLLNIFFIGIFVLILLFINNIKNLKFDIFLQENKRSFLTIFFLLGPIIFWLLLSTPSSRYGGYAIFISFVSCLIAIITDMLINNKLSLKMPFIFLFLISFGYFSYKNIERINSNSNIYPWPEKEILEENIDYKKVKIDNTIINLRMPTNKLLMGNLNEENNYILHCGNIKNLCTPIKKAQCIESINRKFNYIIITNNKSACLKLHKMHALY